MKLREIAVAVAALSLAGTAMAAGNDTRSTTSERLPTARQGQPLDQSTQAKQEPQGSNLGNSASNHGSGSAKMDNGNAANSWSQGSMANEEHNPQLVRSAQQALKQKGYDVGTVDGQLGPNTESALRQFQQSQGITQSGNLDQQTLSALGVDENQAAQSGMSSSQGATSSQGARGSQSSGQSSQPASSSQGSAYK